jgi:hypothetical protein
MAGGAVGGEVVLPSLDVVLGLTARAVELFVQVFGAAARKIGHNACGARGTACGDSRSAIAARANRVDWVFGLARNPTLCRHVAALEKSVAERFRAAPAHGTRRRFTQFYDAAQSWSRVERIIARVEAGPQGTDTRFAARKVRHLAGLQQLSANVSKPSPTALPASRRNGSMCTSSCIEMVQSLFEAEVGEVGKTRPRQARTT